MSNYALFSALQALHNHASLSYTAEQYTSGAPSICAPSEEIIVIGDRKLELKHSELMKHREPLVVDESDGFTIEMRVFALVYTYTDHIDNMCILLFIKLIYIKINGF